MIERTSRNEYNLYRYSSPCGCFFSCFDHLPYGLQKLACMGCQRSRKGAGQRKLRLVYDMAVARFPIVAKLIPFKLFSNMVDAALKIMNEMIKNNASIAEAITNQIEGEDDGI